MDRNELDSILSESGKTDLSVLISAKEEAKQRALQDPSATNLVAMERATNMIEKHLAKEKAADQEPEAQFQDTKNGAAVLRYLQDNGWNLEKTQFYQHVKQGKLVRNAQGLYTRRAVLKYAKDWVPRAETGKKDREDQDDLQRIKLEEEIERIRVQQKRENFKFDVERGKYLLRAEVEQELAGRAVALDAGYNHMVYSRVQEFISVVGGDPAKASMLIELLLTARDDWFNQYASAMDIEVELAENMPPDE
ncbi:MAG: hypothetical protein KKH22_06660 [Proteobacteria bacterium]|nr:hypothetical protein [Pseudomonadota bacterium]